MNEALQKYLEERRNGLAAEDPLTILNRFDKRLQEDVPAGAQRGWLSEMTEEELQAAEGIGIGYRMHAVSVGSRINQKIYGIVGGMRSDELSEFQVQMLKRYKNWRDSLKKRPIIADAAINVFGEGMTLREAARHVHGKLSHNTVKRYCIIAIKHWHEANAERKGRAYYKIDGYAESPSQNTRGTYTINYVE